MKRKMKIAIIAFFLTPIFHLSYYAVGIRFATCPNTTELIERYEKANKKTQQTIEQSYDVSFGYDGGYNCAYYMHFAKDEMNVLICSGYRHHTRFLTSKMSGNPSGVVTTRGDPRYCEKMAKMILDNKQIFH